MGQKVKAYLPMFCSWLKDIEVEIELDEGDHIDIPAGKELHFMGGHGRYHITSRNGKNTYTEMPGGFVLNDEGLGDLCGVFG